MSKEAHIDLQIPEEGTFFNCFGTEKYGRWLLGS